VIKKLLRTNIVWRLTGLTYPTAVIATHGSYVSKDDYLKAGKNEMAVFYPYFNSTSTVLEFGCGLGKNLFGIAHKIKFGYGIDVNVFYVKIAYHLKQHYGIKNLEFISYDGTHFPKLPKVDIILEKGVFERMPKNQVKKYIKELKYNYLTENGVAILYFLMNRAKGSEFTKRLGDEAYIFWNESEITQLLKDSGLYSINIINTKFADFYICK